MYVLYMYVRLYVCMYICRYVGTYVHSCIRIRAVNQCQPVIVTQTGDQLLASSQLIGRSHAYMYQTQLKCTYIHIVQQGINLGMGF